MIQISGRPFQQSNMWPAGSIEKLIVEQMIENEAVYTYPNIGELTFELQLRKNIIASARAMNKSKATFETFEDSRCNPRYWHLTNIGGFQLKDGVLPSEAIRDIYTNSSLYGFECATAMMIIYYHAVLNSVDENVFNYLFSNLYLYSWHFDPDLGIQTVRTNSFLPGDVVYFNNPDFDPETPWWRGENAVLLEDGMYFGHGLGIKTAEQLIQALNKRRKQKSHQSAYLKDSVTRLSASHLAKLSLLPRNFAAYKTQHTVICHHKSSISFGSYLTYLTKAYNQRNAIPPFSQ